MEPSAELQKAIRSRLVASSAVVGIVPALHILDKNSRPEVLPCILIGEGQTVPGGDIARTRHECFADLHIWIEEPGLMTSKQVAGAIREALADSRWSIPGLHVADLYVASSRFLRDPGGKVSHGIISLSATVMETA